ncbi:hypothetical protein IKQ19_20205, partial [Candidatus Saccharibacteria bacterium]|nr:hypothetical protein [Candidatus Saccharibacteria bacterium]
GNATLLAISALVMGNRSDAEIQNTIDKFIADIKTDGEWNDLQTKASMADWAYDFNYSTIKASVKSWNILDIPAYETYLDIYWNNVYGLGGCSVNRKDVVAPNSNKLSKNYNKYFICNGSQWVAATTFQKDTYEWATGKTGEFKKGNVTDSIYVYNGTKWEVSERETAIGLCQNSNAGVVSEFDDVYYICKNNAWTTATALEYDTYGLTGVEGDVKAGVVNKDKYYVYENGAWRAATSEIENNFGACIASRESEKHSLNDKYYVCESKKWFQISAEEFELGYCSTTNAGVVSKSNNVYYICRDNAWKTATPLEYDTYGWKEGIVGEVKKGDITSAYYVYRNNKWNEANSVEQALGSCTTENTGVVKTIGNSYYTCKSSSWTSSTTVERSLGSCTSDNSGTVDKVNSTYYICKNNAWKTATTTEADFYGVSCSKDGAIVNGSVNTAKKYVCDDGTFRSATNDEITLNLGCTSYTRYKIDTVSISHNSIEKWVCGKKWVYGKIVWGEDLIDSRDNKKYKTVIIDTMTWMAENLNYNYYESGNAKSFCYKNSADSCEKYGRLYTWSAAMDSAAVFSESGKGCTANTSVCIPSVNGHVRGVCPEGWHLPSNKEWNFLKSIAKESYGVANASQSEYVSVLKASVKDWETSYSYATDAFGFAVLPAYYGSVSGYNSGCGFTKGRAAFWSYISHKDGVSDYTEALGFNDYEFFGTYFGGTCEMSVRCMKD